MNRKTAVIFMIAGMLFVALLFSCQKEPPKQETEIQEPGRIEVPVPISEIIEMNSRVYEKHKKSIVKFAHKKHSKDYAVGCGECHHGNDNEKNLKKCDECHTEDHKEIVHRNCKGCHQQYNKEKGEKIAPVVCAKCHLKD